MKLIKIDVDEYSWLTLTKSSEEDNNEVKECSKETVEEKDTEDDKDSISYNLKKVRSLCETLHYSEKLTNYLKLYYATTNIEFKRCFRHENSME